MGNFIITAILMFLAATALRGREFYVSPAGSDSNPGSDRAPFRRLSKAAANATRAGDTVIVMDGTYDNEGVVAPKFVVTLRYSGTGDKPITFMAQHRGKAILDSMNTSTTSACNGAASYFNLSNASYIVIQGFVLQRSCDSGIQSNDRAHDITIRWNEIRNIAQRTVTDQFGRDGIYLNDKEYNFTFDGNIFHDIGRTGGQAILHFDHGIYARARRLTIVNNLFYNMNRGWSIQLAEGASDWLIANNTFAFGNANGEPGHIMFWGDNSNIAVHNNIFYMPNESALARYGATITRSAVDRNLIYGVRNLINGNMRGLDVGENLMGVNPGFVNATNFPFDFHLRPRSPAIGAGIKIEGVGDDLEGRERGSRAFDVGAYGFSR